MYLINTTSLKLEYFPDERGIRYAILSHCWGSEEVLFKDMVDQSRNEQIKKLSGYDKILRCCRLAKESDLDYAWVDTCCIDKSSSAELQEAINSMFRWYQSAAVCYAHLADVDDTLALEIAFHTGQLSPTETQFGKSKWFRRGWTLQELLAPERVIFCTRSWSMIKGRNELARIIGEVTGIRQEVLQAPFDPDDRLSVAEIMSWAHGRETTRIEDRAYSLLGLFDVNMPMLYGEGDKAFKRLQEEIMRNSPDHSIFAWGDLDVGHKGLFAPSPDKFVLTHRFSPTIEVDYRRCQPDTITNQGISLTMNLIAWRPFIYVGILSRYVTTKGDAGYIGIYLQAVNDQDCYTRISYGGEALAEIPETFKQYILQDRTVNVIYKLNSWEKLITNREWGPYQCSLYSKHRGENPFYGRTRLCNGATWSVGASYIVLRENSSGIFCTIDVASRNGSIKANGTDSIRQIELGLDCRFLPYCVFVPRASLPRYMMADGVLCQRLDQFVWRKAPIVSPTSPFAPKSLVAVTPLVEVKSLDASTSEYASLPNSHDSLAVRTQNSLYGQCLAGLRRTPLFSVRVQFEDGQDSLTCEITASMSTKSGWTFHIIEY